MLESLETFIVPLCPLEPAITALRLSAVLLVLLASLMKNVTPPFSVLVEPLLSPLSPLLGLYLLVVLELSVMLMKAVGVLPATKLSKGFALKETMLSDVYSDSIASAWFV